MANVHSGLARRVRFAMPRYFFDVFYRTDHPDQDGQRLPDDAAAWLEGTQVAAEMLADLDGDLKPGEHWRLEVTDAARNKLYVIHFNSERMK